MTRHVNVSDVIDARPIGGLQLRAFLLCAAVLFVDGFDVQGITYVVPTITREWGLVRGELWPALTGGLVGVMLGAMFLARALAVHRTTEGQEAHRVARQLFGFSILYLFSLFATLLIERGMERWAA